MPKDLLGEPVVTAAELDAMNPTQLQAAFDARVVTDLQQLPAEYLRRLRERAAGLIARRGPPPPGERAAGARRGRRRRRGWGGGGGGAPAARRVAVGSEDLGGRESGDPGCGRDRRDQSVENCQRQTVPSVETAQGAGACEMLLRFSFTGVRLEGA